MTESVDVRLHGADGSFIDVADRGGSATKLDGWTFGMAVLVRF